MEEQSLLDSLPQEQRQQLARRLRQEQIRQYYARDKASPVSQPERRAGRKRVSFLPREKILDAMKRDDQDEMRKILRDQMASPNTTSEATGASLLHQCCLDNNVLGAQMLLEFGANLNLLDHDRWTPLHMAAACGNIEMTEFLLENNADCTVLDVDGNFAYDNAEREEIRALLLQHMMFNGIYEQDMKSIRSRMAKAMLAAVKDCISRNWNLNQLNKNGVSLLHIAVANGYRQIARLLINAGAEVDIMDDAGYTPLHVAAKFNQAELVKLLLRKRANPRAKNKKLETPINLTDSDTITELLRQAGGEGTLLHQSPDRDLPLTPADLHSVSIDLDEFESARAKSKSLNRDMPISKLEKLFEAETLSERDSYDIGSDDSTQAPALARIRGSRKSRRESVKVELPDAASTDNLATLSDLDERILLQYLKERYHCDQIYTYIGEILVAVNPFKQLPYYTDMVSNKYSESQKDPVPLPPHIFAVASQIYHDMLAERRPQCCIISGESGAGKTESCKFIVQHLLYITSSVERELNLKIEQVNPVLEAFGNARTVMNNNSSRFGKFLELVFNTDGLVMGANFKEYLLEKSRVVFQGKGERNFHIFYQMFAGLSPEEKALLKLDTPNKHRCLVGSGTALEGAVTPEAGNRFQEIRDSLQAIGFSKEDEQRLLEAISGVLHVCDISFAPDEEGSVITNPHKVQIVSGLLQVGVQELSSCLVEEVTVTRGEKIIRNRTVVQANDCRDALAKALYGRMFGWIVNGINHHLQPEDVNHTTLSYSLRIGVLDIFGFENFEKNSFEQMCINLANEQLQHHFNEHIFKWEQEECAKEGIAIETICYRSNWPVVNLFLERNLGLLALIDEESQFPRASDKSLATKLHNTHSNDTNGIYKAPRDRGTTFGIMHYPGHVQYNMAGFLDKNRDTLPPSILFLMKSSGNLMIREVFGAKMTRTGSVAPSVRQKMSRKAVSPFSFFNRKASRKLSMSKNLSRKKMAARDSSATKGDSARRGPPTVANHFRNSLSELMAKMNSSSPHFIRCLKPNTVKEPNNFSDDYIMSQLKCTGIMETTRIRQCGFPTRLTFEDFQKRYWPLHDFYRLASLPAKEAACQLLEKAGVKGWECGRTKIFLKFCNSEQLEECTRDISRKAVIMQKCIRQWLARKRMKRLAEARQRQALAVEQLLTTISKSGTDCYEILQATNETLQKEAQNLEQNVSSVGQKVSPEEHQSSAPINQGWEGNYASTEKMPSVKQVPMHPMVKQSSAASSGEYLLQTSPQDDEYRDEDIYEDVLTQPEVRPVQHIRSVRVSDDDIIPVATSSQLIIQEGSTTGVLEEEEELYDDLVGVMQQPPTVPIYQHDAVTLNQNPPEEIYENTITLRQNPPDEIYDDAIALRSNFPAVTSKQTIPEEIYDDAVSLRQNPPDEVYEVVANTKQDPLEEIYDDAVNLRQNLPAPPGRNILSPSYKERSQGPTPPPIPSRSSITESGNRGVSVSTPPLPIPVRSPHTQLSSSRPPPPLPEETTVSYATRDEPPTIPVRSPNTQLSSSRPPPPLPEETGISYMTRDEPPTIPVRSPNTRLSSSRPPPPLPEETGISYMTRDEPPSIPARSPNTRLSSSRPPPPLPEETTVSYATRDEPPPPIPLRSSDTKLTTAQGMHRKTPPHSDPPPLPPRKESLSHADKPQQMARFASRDSTEAASPPNNSRSNKPNVTNLPSKSFHNRLSNLFEGGSPAPSPSTKTKQQQQQQRERIPLEPSPPTKQQQRERIPSQSPGIPVLPAKVQQESSNRSLTKQHNYEEVLPVLPHFPPVGHPFNPMSAQQLPPPSTGQSVKASAQNIPPAPPPPPPPPGAPVPPPPPPIGNSKLTLCGSAVPTAPPPPSVGVPTAPVPPPPPTPPTAHPPSQGVPPAPPPPIIGQPRPKVSPVSTRSQPTPGSARPSKVPSGQPSMGELLAGLADVKLKKASDRALPDLTPPRVSVPQALVPGTPSMPPTAPPPPPIAPPLPPIAPTPPSVGVPTAPIPPPTSMPPTAPPPPSIGVPTAPVPPPPPTPPTAHSPSQGVPPAPPPPIIGQPRPKVSPVSTGSQPTPGNARPSKVPSGPSMGDLLAGLADVKLRKPEDRALPEKKAAAPPRPTSTTDSLMAEMQSFQLRKSPGPKRHSVDVSKLDEPDGPPGQPFPPLHKLPASPSGAGKPKGPPPVVSPRPNARTRSESSPALPPSPLVGTSVTSPIARPNNGSGSDSAPAATIPEWKRVLQEKKQKEQLAKEAAKQEEEAKWAAVPEWKRKLLLEKQKKVAEESVPETIPEWKRNLILKKQEQ